MALKRALRSGVAAACIASVAAPAGIAAPAVKAVAPAAAAPDVRVATAEPPRASKSPGRATCAARARPSS